MIPKGIELFENATYDSLAKGDYDVGFCSSLSSLFVENQKNIATRQETTMSLLGKLRRAAEKLTGTHIYRELPPGLDFASDIQAALPHFRARVIFDVGANVGQSASLMSARFPESEIYSFEPSADTYQQLQRNVQQYDRVHCIQLALGASKKIAQMALDGSSDRSFLIDESTQESPKDVSSESVQVDTLDSFCSAKKIDRINFLKIDTEGGDLDVLKGAAMLLKEHRVDIVEVEAGMNPNNERHVPFETLKAFLESNKYYLFGIYEQVKEWPTRSPNLRRTNPIFLSQATIEQNRS